MAIYKNKSSQKLAVYAHDTSADAPKTGDAANITAQISLDGGTTAATNDVNPTELDATDAPGVYLFDLTQAESNADLVIVAAVSSTANIQLEPAIIYTEPETRAANVTQFGGTAGVFNGGRPEAILAQTTAILRKADGTTVLYNTASDTDSARGTAIISAQTASAAGDRIEVYANATIASTIGKNGVDWWFAPGVTITGGSGVKVLGGDVDGGATVVYTIDGHGEFISNDAVCARFEEQSSRVTIRCRRIRSTGASNPGVAAVNGSIVYLYVSDEINAAAYEPVLCRDDSIIYLDAGTLSSDSSVGLIVEADGNIIGRCNRIVVTDGQQAVDNAGVLDLIVTHWINGNVNDAGTMRLYCPYIKGTVTVGAGSTIRGAVIDSQAIASASVTVGATGATLESCRLLTAGAQTNSLTAASAYTVTVVGGIAYNKALNNVTLSYERTPVQATIGGRTLDITATGAAGVDWANVEGPTTSLNLSGTTISASQAVASVSGAVGSVTGNVGGNVTGSVGSVAGAVAELGPQALSDIGGTVDTSLSDVGLSTTVTGRIDAAVSTRMATYTQPTGFLAATFPATIASTTNITAGTITTVSGNVTGSVGSISGVTFPTNFATLGINASGHITRVTLADTVTTLTGYVAPLDAAGIRTAVGLGAANLDTQLSGISSKTDQLTFTEANKVDATATATIGDEQIATMVAGFTAALAQNSRIIIVSPLSASEMTIIKGDDYTQAGTTIALTKASGELGWPSSITTIDFSCAPDDALQEEQSILATAGLDDIALTSVSASGGTLSLTAVQTAALVATTGKGRYRFWFVANRSTYPKTIRQGTLRVVMGDTN